MHPLDQILLLHPIRALFSEGLFPVLSRLIKTDRGRKHLFIIIIPILILCLVMGCRKGGGPTQSSEPKVTSVSIQAEETNLDAERSMTLKVTVLPEDASNKTIIWESSDDSIATVSPSGVVRGVSPGEVIITATSEESPQVSDSLTLRINSGNKDITLFVINEVVGTIDSSRIDITLPSDTEVTNLTPTIVHTGVSINPESGVPQDFTNPVDYTVMAEDSSVAIWQVNVTLEKPPVSSVSVETDETNIGLGLSLTLEALVLPEDAANRAVRWESSDESIATVDSSGVVRGVSPGEVIIMAISEENPEIRDSITLRVQSGSKDITSVVINEVAGSISGTTVEVILPDGTEVTNLTPTIVHTGVSINPGSGVPQNFTNPVNYTVTAEDGSEAIWQVSVTLEESVLTYRDVIESGNEIPPFDNIRQETVLSRTENTRDEPDADGNTVRLECVTEEVDLKDGAGDFSLFNTNAEVIFPGNLLQFKTLSEPTPSPIPVKREGGTISINIVDGNANSSVTVDEITKSKIQDAMNQIINTSNPQPPANFSLEIEQIESEEQLAVELGVNVETFNASVEANMSFSRDREYNRLLVKLNQSMFTMSWDIPTSLNQVFDESVTPEALSAFVQPDNPATFISSVTFGRIFFMLIESTSSRQELQASVQAGFSGVAVDASVGVDVAKVEELSDLRIKVIAYGGVASSTIGLFGETDLSVIADALAESSDIRSALPTSYVVRSVERPDQIVGTNLATQFSRTTCEVKGLLPFTNYRGLVDIFGPDDHIGAAFNLKGTHIVVYNSTGTEYVVYDVNFGEIKGRYTHNDPNGPLGVSALNSVGAGFKMHDRQFQQVVFRDIIALIDSEGIRSQILVLNNTIDPGSSALVGTYGSEVLSVDELLASNTGDPNVNDTGYAFPGDGTRAAAGLPLSFNNRTGFDRTSYILFAESTDEFMQGILKPVKNQTGVENVDKTSNFEAHPVSVLSSNSSYELFNRIGAAAIVRFSGGGEQLLIINEDGDLMLYLDGIETNPNNTRFDEISLITPSNFQAFSSGFRVLK
ncbi:MAG: thiol-activated cytolysin family protein [Bacteroidota bacterium]